MQEAWKGAQRASFDQIPGRSTPSSPSRSRPSSRGSRSLLRAIAISLPVLLLLPVLAVPAAAHGRVADRRVAPKLAPGALVRDHGLTVTVPQRGGFVWGELKLADGTWQEIAVETDLDGTVYVRGRGDERAATIAERRAVAARGTAGAAPGAKAEIAGSGGSGECRDDFRNLYWWRLPRLDWKFNPARTPHYLLDADGTTRRVQAAIQRAQDNITGSTNRCARGDRVGATGALMGITRRVPNVSGTARCTGGDGQSVIGFGDLPSYSIAMTCVYGVRNGVARESDIRMNHVDTRWATDKATCSGRDLLIEGAMTHEFGHAYGLAHASIYRNPSLTMQPLVRACSMGHSTLGLGDMLGLEKKY